MISINASGTGRESNESVAYSRDILQSVDDDNRRGHNIQEFLQFGGRRGGDIEHVFVHNGKTLRHKEAGRILEIDLIDDRYLAIGCGFGRRLPFQGLAVFKTENKHRAGIGAGILQAAGSTQGLGQGYSLGLKINLFVFACCPQDGET